MFNLFKKRKVKEEKTIPMASRTVSDYTGGGIRFQTHQTTSLGRNGIMKCLGLDINPKQVKDSREEVPGSLKCVEIAPINTKELVGRSNIRIPKEDIPAFIIQLELYYNSNN